MPRMSKKRKQEWALFLNNRNRITYNELCRKCRNDCEECDLSVRAGVLMERLKAYEPELPQNMEPMGYVNYCEKSELGNPRCQKLSDLDFKTVEQDKA